MPVVTWDHGFVSRDTEVNLRIAITSVAPPVSERLM